MNSAGVVVRPACVDDFEAWFALYEAVAAEGKWIAGESPSDRADRQLSFEAHLADEDVGMLVAEADGSLVGTLFVQIHRGIAELGMQVAAEWRRLGVGSKLMETCIAWAADRGAHKIVLELWPHNTAARALYRKYGFEQEGYLRRQYRRRNGELWDAVRMGLVLDRRSPGSPYARDQAG